MRIGYSFWGFLGPGITDTPDGGRSHRRTLIDGADRRGHDIVFLQPDRDRAEAGTRRWPYTWDSSGFPDIDVLFLEWRWPIAAPQHHAVRRTGPHLRPAPASRPDRPLHGRRTAHHPVGQGPATPRRRPAALPARTSRSARPRCTPARARPRCCSRSPTPRWTAPTRPPWRPVTGRGRWPTSATSTTATTASTPSSRPPPASTPITWSPANGPTPVPGPTSGSSAASPSARSPNCTGCRWPRSCSCPTAT